MLITRYLLSAHAKRGCKSIRSSIAKVVEAHVQYVQSGAKGRTALFVRGPLPEHLSKASRKSKGGLTRMVEIASLGAPGVMDGPTMPGTARRRQAAEEEEAMKMAMAPVRV